MPWLVSLKKPRFSQAFTMEEGEEMGSERSMVGMMEDEQVLLASVGVGF